MQNAKSLFRKLDIKAPIGAQLANILILEHPVIFIYLPSHDIGFEFEAARTPFLRNTAPSTSDGIPSHNGTSYRVEEVEEGDMPSDTRVTDLMDCMKSNSLSNPSVTKETSKADNAVLVTDKQIPEAISVGLSLQLSGEPHRTHATNSPESGDTGFYFEQELKTVFSDLMGEMNPDDFLCFDGVYDDSVDLGEARWYGMEERGRDDAEEVREVELDEGREAALMTRKGGGLEEELVVDLEERESNVLKQSRNGDQEEERESSFPSGRILFGEIELEEGEIPCFL